MGASRAVLLPRIKPRARYFGAGAENENADSHCTTPHPDKKTQTRSGFPRGDTEGRRGDMDTHARGGGGTKNRGEPNNHTNNSRTTTPMETLDTKTTRSTERQKSPASTSGSSHPSADTSRNTQLDRLRLSSRALGTKLVRAAVAADHCGSAELAAAGYENALAHFEVYLKLESDENLALAVSSKAEQYRARLKRIQEVLQPKKEDVEDVEEVEEVEVAPVPGVPQEEQRKLASNENATLAAKTQTKPPRQPLRRIQRTNETAGRFVVTLATRDAGHASGSQHEMVHKHGRVLAGPTLAPDVGSGAPENALEAASAVAEDLAAARDDGGSTAVSKVPKVSQTSITDTQRVTDEEADAWVEEHPRCGVVATPGERVGGLTTTGDEKLNKTGEADTTGDEKTTRDDTKTGDTKASGDATKIGDANTPPGKETETDEEHPPPPSTPPVASQSFRHRTRSAYWDSEFGVFEFGDGVSDEVGDTNGSSSSGDTSNDPVDDFDKAVLRVASTVTDWFDASLKKFDHFSQNEFRDFKTETEKTVTNFITRSSYVINQEWRQQFPDDATYVSEMAKKEYPSEANATMASAPVQGDSKKNTSRRCAKSEKAS